MLVGYENVWVDPKVPIIPLEQTNGVISITHCRCDANSKYKNKCPSEEELSQLIDRHKQWLESLEKTTSPAERLALVTDLYRADLCEANLNGVHLENVNLSKSNLCKVNLGKAFIKQTDLSESVLERAKLSMAHLSRVNLSGASLISADLNDAKLEDVTLSDTCLEQADLNNVQYEPKLGAQPSVLSIGLAKNIENMRFEKSPAALVELREAFKKAGMREQERKITYAIKHSEMLKAGSVEYVFGYLLFELPTAWGMLPGRALKILFWLIFVFWIFYLIAILIARGETPLNQKPPTWNEWKGLYRGTDWYVLRALWWRFERDGIWRVWSENRVRHDLGKSDATRLTFTGPGALGLALYFSVLSAFHFGWLELNVGNWVTRIQPREYTLRATGWVRAISGFQSLISIYLVAIWALTYFGRPFE